MKKLIIAVSILSSILALPCISQAGQITYSIVNYPDDQNGASLSGFITTDGTLGYLTAGNILSWAWTITPPVGAAFTVTSSDVGSITYLQNSTSLFSSSSELTIAAAGAAGGNAFAMLNDQPVTEDLFVEYDRFSVDQYSGFGAEGKIWATPSPSMGGTNPWVIAVASVPEPSSCILAGLGLAGVIFHGRLRNRNPLRPVSFI